MPRYNNAKQEFLTWLSDQAGQHGTELTLNRSSRGYYREPDVLARLRATTQRSRFQTRNTNDERSVSEELTERFDNVLCVILQLSNPSGFNPHTDHFYPVRATTIQRHSGSRHATGEYQLNFDLTGATATHFRDNIRFALGLRSAGDSTHIGPSKSSPLQEIARTVCRSPEPNDD